MCGGQLAVSAAVGRRSTAGMAVAWHFQRLLERAAGVYWAVGQLAGVQWVGAYRRCAVA